MLRIPSCEKLLSVNEPYLVFIAETGGIPTKGRCSACKNVFFVTGADVGLIEEHLSSLEKQFRDHVRKVHMQGKASEITASPS